LNISTPGHRAYVKPSSSLLSSLSSALANVNRECSTCGPAEMVSSSPFFPSASRSLANNPCPRRHRISRHILTVFSTSLLQYPYFSIYLRHPHSNILTKHHFRHTLWAASPMAHSTSSTEPGQGPVHWTSSLPSAGCRAGPWSGSRVLGVCGSPGSFTRPSGRQDWGGLLQNSCNKMMSELQHRGSWGSWAGCGRSVTYQAD
jgi:hypothetical protein